jgi:hypothetical protein
MFSSNGSVPLSLMPVDAKKHKEVEISEPIRTLFRSKVTQQSIKKTL